MSLTETTDSPQHRQHWLAEQVLNWSGLPVVHVRATVFLQHPFFLEWAAETVLRDGTIRLPPPRCSTASRTSRPIHATFVGLFARARRHRFVHSQLGPHGEIVRGRIDPESEMIRTWGARAGIATQKDRARRAAGRFGIDEELAVIVGLTDAGRIAQAGTARLRSRSSSASTTCRTSPVASPHWSRIIHNQLFRMRKWRTGPARTPRFTACPPGN